MATTKTGVNNVAASILVASSRQILGPNPQRIAAIFVAPATNRYTIGFAQAAVLDQGLTIPPATQAFAMTKAEYGSLIEHPFTAISAVADQTIQIIEVSLGL